MSGTAGGTGGGGDRGDGAGGSRGDVRGAREGAEVAFVAVGGNLGTEGELIQRFQSAVAMLAADARVRRVRRSALYRSAPVGPVVEQPRFLNGVVAVELAEGIGAVALLRLLLEIERRHGRDRAHGVAQGPRTLDLDLLVMGERVVREAGPPEVVVPHPRMCERAFVLRPLQDLVGARFVVPGVGCEVGECLARVEGAGRERVERVREAGAW